MSTIWPAHKAAIPAAGLGALAPRSIVPGAAGARPVEVVGIGGQPVEPNVWRADRIAEPVAPPVPRATRPLWAALADESRHGAISLRRRCDRGVGGHDVRAGARPASAAVRPACERLGAGLHPPLWPEDLEAGEG
jgi:hypothetical protein